MSEEPKTLKEKIAAVTAGLSMVKFTEVHNIPFTQKRPQNLPGSVNLPLLMLPLCLKQRGVLKYAESRITKGTTLFFVVEFYTVSVTNPGNYSFNKVEIAQEFVQNPMFVEFMQRLEEMALFND